MRKTINLLLGALLVVFAASCKKSETPEPQYQTDIYVAGYEEGDIYDIATYWKNDKIIYLTDGTRDAYAEDIVVSGEDVYVAGSEFDGSRRIAKYWKNGTAIPLSDGSNHADAYSIFIAGTDVYVAGRERLGTKYRAVDNAALVDLLIAPDAPRGLNAGGTNHHVAFRVKDEKMLMAIREEIVARGLHITEKINRDYFFSLYFREPGGVLFEIATDNPGFATDEPVEHLGNTLQLPDQFEVMREVIEKGLPEIKI